MKLLNSKLLIAVFFAIFFFSFNQKVDAAFLQMRPSQNEVSVGNIINIQITVDTLGKVINNAESIIQFPKDLLEVVSIDKRSSIFSLWVEEPGFSNSVGQITFNGGVPNPGFTGGNGNIVSIIFRAKKTGLASIIFSNSAVRENDGLGTDIISGTSNSQINIINLPAVEPVKPVPVEEPKPALLPVEEKTKNEPESTDSEIAPPLNIDLYPSKIKVNESIEISGTAPYKYGLLKISLKDKDGLVQTHQVKTNSYYQFSFISQPILKEGNYTVWVEALADDKNITLSSQNINIFVEKPLILSIGSYTIGLMKVLIPAAILVIIFILLIMYGWYKFFNLYRRVKKESLEAEKVLGKSFDILHSDLREYIQKLRKAEFKRKLTKEEIEFLEKFDDDLTDAEDIISKEIKDVSRK